MTFSKQAVWLLILALCIGGAQAATLTCQQVSDTSMSIAQFSSDEIEIRCTASGGTVGSITISPNADPSTGLTISSSQTISTSLADSGSGTAKWSVTGDSPNTYSVTYTVNSDGTNSWTGASTTQVIVTSPAQLTVEYVNAPSTWTSGSTLNFKINNIGGTTANNVKLKLNSGSLVNYASSISAGSTASDSWTASDGFDSADTYVTSVYIGDTLHDSASATVSAAAPGGEDDDNDDDGSSGDDAAGGGGGGGGGGAATSKESASFALVGAGETVSMSLSSGVFGVETIDMVLTEAAEAVELTVQKLSSKPSSIEKNVSGKAYKYLSISHRNIDQKLEKATFSFAVERSWMDAKGFSSDQIVMQRYDGSKWQNLPTVWKRTNNTHMFFTATTTHFSYFAIVGVPKEEAAALATEAGDRKADDESTVDTLVEEGASEGEEGIEAVDAEVDQDTAADREELSERSLTPTIIFVGLIAIVIIVVLVLLAITNRKKKQDDQPRVEVGKPPESN